MCRLDIIRTLAAGSDLGLRDSDWERLLDRTEGFSGSDLADLVKNALYQPIRELTTATYWRPVERESRAPLLPIAKLAPAPASTVTRL